MCQVHCARWLVTHSVSFDAQWGSYKGVLIFILMIVKLRPVGPKTHNYLMVGPRFNLCTLGILFSFVKLTTEF